MKTFLYGQTEYNLLNNAMHLDDYLSYAKKYGYSALTITDSNLYGFYKFYKKCEANSIKPIIGLEVKVMNDDEFNDCILLYPTTNNGIKNLILISSIIKTNKEKITYELLKKYSQDISFVLVINESFFTRCIEKNDLDMAYNGIITMKETFSHFYLGISNQSFRNYEFNQKAFEFAKANDIKCLPVHQTLYLEDNDRIAYEYLRNIDGGKSNLSVDDDYSFPKDLDEEFNNYFEIETDLNSFIESINYSLFKNLIALPTYPNTKDKTSEEFLKDLCIRGLSRRLGSNSSQKTIYETRLFYELSVIHKMGYDDYFLIVWDYIKFAKTNDIYVGPGRGSAAGSLVAYCLGITDVDPLKFDLLFERFLNPERISMPDIDTDFPDDKRDLVIEHVKDLYGKTHVANISAFGTFLVKSSIRDIARVMKITTSRVDEIVDLASNTSDYEALLLKFKDNEEIYNLLTIAKKLENLPRHISTHAAGIVLSKDELQEIIPLQEGINGLYQSQLEASDLEKIGLLKMDFLGIRNLTVIDNIIKNIPSLDQKTIRQIPLDDKATFDLLKRGDTLGIFQLESNGITRVIKKLSPDNFEDLVAVLALYRPGPMDNIDEFILRRHGKKYELLDPTLDKVLSSTYGIIVYQEQIMNIASIYAGYSLGEADLLRRAVSKKDEKTLLQERTNFIKRSMILKHSESDANKIYDYIVKFANYGFNRSHSVAYAMLSYQMAYLKANYFKLFIAEIMNNSIGNQVGLAKYINYATSNKIRVFHPEINYSDSKFVVTEKGLIMPFTSIYSIGLSISNDIVEERKKGLFKSFEDFRERVTSVSERACQAFIYSSCFDMFKRTKRSLVEQSGDKVSSFDKFLPDLIITNKEYDKEILAEAEKKYLGINLVYNPFKNINSLYKMYNATPISYTGEYVKYIGMFLNLKSLRTKKGETMARGILYDNSSRIDMVIFPSAYQNINYPLNEHELFLVNGHLKKDAVSLKDEIIIDSVSVIKEKQS